MLAVNIEALDSIMIWACILVLIENGLIASGTIDLGAFNYLASFILIIAMSFMTVASGINYLKIYMPYMNSNK